MNNFVITLTNDNQFYRNESSYFDLIQSIKAAKEIREGFLEVEDHFGSKALINTEMIVDISENPMA